MIYMVFPFSINTSFHFKAYKSQDQRLSMTSEPFNHCLCPCRGYCSQACCFLIPKLSHFRSHPAKPRAGHTLIPELKAPPALSSLAHIRGHVMLEKGNLVLLIFKGPCCPLPGIPTICCMTPAGLSWGQGASLPFYNKSRQKQPRKVCSQILLQGWSGSLVLGQQTP